MACRHVRIHCNSSVVNMPVQYRKGAILKQDINSSINYFTISFFYEQNVYRYLFSCYTSMHDNFPIEMGRMMWLCIAVHVLHWLNSSYCGTMSLCCPLCVFSIEELLILAIHEQRPFVIPCTQWRSIDICIIVDPIFSIQSLISQIILLRLQRQI